MLGRRAATADDPAGTAAPGTAEAATPEDAAAQRRPGMAGAAGGVVAGAAVAGTHAVGTLFVTVARLVRAVAALIFLLIVIAIVLRDLNAHQSNSIVKAIHDGANFFASPFTGLFSVHGAKAAITLNWGIAAVVYLIVGAIIAAIIATPGHGLRRVGRRPRRI